MLIATDASRYIPMNHADTAFHLADVRALGKAPSQPHFLPFHFWYLTDLNQSPTQPLSPCTLWDIHGWSCYPSTTGYHEPHEG